MHYLPPFVLSLSKDARPAYDEAWVSMLAFCDAATALSTPGYTDNLDLRIAAHEQGEASGYTAPRRPIALVWSESFGTRDEALAAERRIRGWSRAKKQALVEGNWERIKLLARNRQTGG